jgi:hypothetical protein
MKKLVVTCIAAILIAAPAHAQLFLGWNACLGTPGSSGDNLNFDCTPGSGFMADIWGTLALPDSMPDFHSVESLVDFAFQGAAEVPPFWHFELGGCNSPGIAYFLARGANAVPCASSTNSVAMCRALGSACTGGIAQVIIGSALGGPNRLRLVCTNIRTDPTPVTLPGPPLRIFCFRMTFLTDNSPGSGGADCEGCDAPTAIAWNEAKLFYGDDSILVIDSGMVGFEGVLPANGANISVGASRKSWGQLKGLYR